MRRPIELAAGLLSLGFIGLFFAYPVITLLHRALSGADGGRIQEVLTGGGFGQTVWFTTWQAALSTLVTFAVGLPAAAVLANRSFRGRSLLTAWLTVAFVLPTVVVAGAFRALFEWLGVDDVLIGSVWGIVAAHAFFNVAVVVRVVGGFWSHLDPTSEQAARSLGASPGTTFRLVTLPLLRPSLVAAASIVFLFTFTSFGVILLLGDGLRPTVETEIWRYGVRRLELDVAAAIAVVQLVAVIALSAVSTALQRRAAVRQPVVGARARGRPMRTARERIGAASWLAPTVVLVTLPIAVLVARSLDRGEQWSVEGYRELLEHNDLLATSPLATVASSIQVAVAATLISVTVGTVASLVVVHGRRWHSTVVDAGLLVPLGTSAVTLGFGLFLAFDTDPLAWRTSWWILPIAHSLVGIPFVIRAVVPVLRSLDDRVRDAARTLGASPSQVLRSVDLPVAGRGIAVGAAFAFAVSMGEFGATSVLPRSADDITAPIAVFRLLGTPGEALRTQAFALSVVVLVVVALAVSAIDRLRPPGSGSGW